MFYDYGVLVLCHKGDIVLIKMISGDPLVQKFILQEMELWVEWLSGWLRDSRGYIFSRLY